MIVEYSASIIMIVDTTVPVLLCHETSLYCMRKYEGHTWYLGLVYPGLGQRMGKTHSVYPWVTTRHSVITCWALPRIALIRHLFGRSLVNKTRGLVLTGKTVSW